MNKMSELNEMQELNGPGKMGTAKWRTSGVFPWKKALLVGIVACTFALPTLANAEEMMMAKKFDYTGVQTMMKDGMELVPLRQVAESLGFKVTWQDETHSIVLSKMMMDDKMMDKTMTDKSMMGSTYIIQIDSMMIKEGDMDGMLKYAPMLINSMTYVPKAFVDMYLLK